MHTEEEYQAALRQIDELKAKLEQAENNYKSVMGFMSRTSHEIRTPMNSIIGLARLGEEECVGRSAEKYFTKIKESAGFQLEILNDILDMARIESGGIVLYPEPYSLGELGENLSAIVSPLMEQKHIEFVMEFHDIFADVLMADKLRLRQIFLNLLTNAAKFTPENGRIEFIVSQLSSGSKVKNIFVVRDNGIGMSEEFCRRMFTPFEQERTAETAGIQGTGLGLAITKNLVGLMNGEISVRSELGAGTEFTVELDLAPSENIAAAEKRASGECDFKGMHALIIDDHSINRILEIKLLKKAGFETDVANNGLDGLKKFMASEDGYYDVVLMDIKMPVMDGIEAAKKIRSLDRTDAEKVRILAMSANAYPEDIEKTKAAGMDAHIAKPIIPSVLYGQLSRLLVKDDDHSGDL